MPIRQGQAVGLQTNRANIGAEIDEAVLRTKVGANFCWPISRIFLADAA